MERRKTNYLLHGGLDEDEEKLNGAKAQMLLPAGEGRNEEASGQGQPGREAAAAEGERAGELSGEGPSAADAAGLIDNLSQKDHGTSGSDQENEKQPKQPVGEGPRVAESVQPVSVLVRQRCFHYKFRQWQLQELERIFQHSHYISAEVRKQLARWIGVTEARVQNWFKGRREQYRRDQKL
ncbi:rhox homeobox family member 2-like [Peromyscus californicus insignis]|uniref:rhox homeobox family member 2-like n=1 Tax=Peromyscus californicus insignis TaxID=564181 RepID=UPI0022A6AEFB|nr:rhox homeobox family member 2-like [Peromyscus californicus insignis]